MENKVYYGYKAQLNDDCELISLAKTREKLEIIKRNIDGCAEKGCLNELIIEGGKYNKAFKELCAKGYRLANKYIAENTIYLCGFTDEGQFKRFLELAAIMVKEKENAIKEAAFSGNIEEIITIADELRSKSVENWVSLLEQRMNIVPFRAAA